MTKIIKKKHPLIVKSESFVSNKPKLITIDKKICGIGNEIIKTIFYFCK